MSTSSLRWDWGSPSSACSLVSDCWLVVEAGGKQEPRQGRLPRPIPLLGIGKDDAFVEELVTVFAGARDLPSGGFRSLYIEVLVPPIHFGWTRNPVVFANATLKSPGPVLVLSNPRPPNNRTP